MIKVESFSHSYGPNPAVINCSFEVAPGEVVGLLGPNGSGKSTTLRAVAGAIAPDGGTCKATRPLGWLQEKFVAYDGLTVGGYLRFVARIKGVRFKIDERLDLRDLLRRPIGRLSHGQYQRVGWAQALIGQPKVVLLDEPTAGLDPLQILESRAIVSDLKQAGVAVLYSTHALSEARVICDRVVGLFRGRVVLSEEVGPNLEQRFFEAMSRAEMT